jgi:dUTP pyrophosphatase
MHNKKINIHRLDDSLPLPKYETKGSFAFDFLARETTIIQPKNLGLIPGNVIVQCPENLALMVLPRSSTFRKKSLIFPHSVGLIDADYCGAEDEIMIQVFNFSDEIITIQRGEKIAQGLFIQTAKVDFSEVSVETLGESRGGFGSTDKKDSTKVEM